MKPVAPILLLLLLLMAAPAAAHDGLFASRGFWQCARAEYVDEVVRARAEARLCDHELLALVEHQRWLSNQASTAARRVNLAPGPGYVLPTHP
jgi:hypothetical protein